MAWIQGKGWLLLGLVAAIAVPAAGLHTWLPAALTRRMPLPWAEILIGVLIFFAFAGLYFRDHWSATAGARRREHERVAGVASDLRELASDVDRSGAVMVENLAEVARDPGAPTSRLYLEGARAHASRLRVLAERARGLVANLVDPKRRR